MIPNTRLHSLRFAAIPSVDRLLRDSRVRAAIASHGRSITLDEIRRLLDEHRGRLKAGKEQCASSVVLVDQLIERLEALAQPSMRRVFNLTGTVLHTNLGRAVLPPAAAEAARQALLEPCNLEYDLTRGERGERDAHVDGLICRLTGAEAATVVNNNAAAILLALNTLAQGREVLVSRGELVEIGGSFRMPEIIEAAGCRLREVGTTNRTHHHDYERALGAETAAVLKVHTSNYTVVGFVAAPSEIEMARIAHARGVPLVVDLGSGSLVPLKRWQLPPEPTPSQSLAAGADIVTFSGDKLLGGPQAGIAVGRRALIQQMQRNPIKRALRVDKARLAALEAVLRLYLDPDRLAERLPALRCLTRPAADLARLAERLRPVLQDYCGASASVDMAACASQVGSGSLPIDRVPGVALRVRPLTLTADGIAARLRSLPIPVIARVHDGAVWLDLRCLNGEADETVFADQLRGRSL